MLAATDPGVRERRLRTYTAALRLNPVSGDGEVAEAWARLRILLHDAGSRMPVNDSWIAATALALAVPVVTQDSDFPDVDGLDVIRV